MVLSRRDWRWDDQLLDLRGTDLRGAPIKTGAHLEGTNFRQAHLKGANLRGVYLEGVVFQEAHLQGANLEGAHLQGADLDESARGSPRGCEPQWGSSGSDGPTGSAFGRGESDWGHRPHAKPDSGRVQ